MTRTALVLARLLDLRDEIEADALPRPFNTYISTLLDVNHDLEQRAIDRLLGEIEEVAA